MVSSAVSCASPLSFGVPLGHRFIFVPFCAKATTDNVSSSKVVTVFNVFILQFVILWCKVNHFIFIFVTLQQKTYNSDENEEDSIGSGIGCLLHPDTGKGKIAAYYRRQHGTATTDGCPSLGLGQARQDREGNNLVEQ
jgi:hypothetical protein